MQSIGGFFDKFRNRAVAQINNLSIITEAIKKHTGADIEMKNISISSGILRIQSSQIVKNEIFIKKNMILKEISDKIQNLKIADIR